MAYLTADELLDTEDGFTEWNEGAAAGLTEETLEQALAEERLAELESELEQESIPLIMMPSWRPRRKKRPRSAISG